MSGVEVKRARINENGTEVEGWTASFDGTTAVGHGREEALRNLVVAVAQEAL